jgi:branched-chain amino acid transport system permease protein
MSTSVLGSLISNTLVLGSMYALVGIGFVILFRSTGVVNFAQGSLMVLAAYLVYTCAYAFHLPLWVGFIVSIVLTGVLGGLFYLTMFRRMVGADLFVTVIATLGLSVVVQMITIMIWGAQVRPMPELPSGKPVFSIGSAPFSAVDLIAIILSAVLIVVLELGLRRTALGIATRAVADSTHLAALMKVRVHAISATAWAVSAMCAAVAGSVLSLIVGSVDPVSIGQLGLLVFPVVIIGGVDSVNGALVGGILIAAIQNLVQYYLGGNWVDPIAYAALLVMLLVRPRGMFGSHAVARI